jgi:hypothetical protein
LPRKHTDSTARTQQEIEEIWELEPHLTVVLDEATTGTYVQELLDTAMIFWFHDRSPPLDHFSSWAEEEFYFKRNWTIEQTKFAGRNFFIVKFLNKTHLDKALQGLLGLWDADSCIPLLGHLHLMSKLSL